MIVALLTVFGAFAVLWMVPLFALQKGEGEGAIRTRFAIVMITYGALFLAAVWWWHVPLSQAALLRPVATSARVVNTTIECSQIDAATKSLSRSSNGSFAVAPDGTLTLKREVWTRLSEAQRQGLEALADRVATCANEDSAKEGTVRDMATGAIFDSEDPTR